MDAGTEGQTDMKSETITLISFQIHFLSNSIQKVDECSDFCHRSASLDHKTLKIYGQYLQHLDSIVQNVWLPSSLCNTVRLVEGKIK